MKVCGHREAGVPRCFTSWRSLRWDSLAARTGCQDSQREGARNWRTICKFSRTAIAILLLAGSGNACHYQRLRIPGQTCKNPTRDSRSSRWFVTSSPCPGINPFPHAGDAFGLHRLERHCAGGTSEEGFKSFLTVLLPHHPTAIGAYRCGEQT